MELYKVEELYSFLQLQRDRVYCIVGLSHYPYLRSGCDNLESERELERRRVP
jgi:hypothetical protein